MRDLLTRAAALRKWWQMDRDETSQETAAVLIAMEDEFDRLQRAVGLKDAALRQAMADVERLRPCERLARDLLDPERFGHAVSAEIRDAARRVLGISTTESTRRMASLNADTAWRDAITWPRGSMGEEVQP